MATVRKRKKTQKKAEKPVISKSPAAFERAFFARIGQTSEDFIDSKLAAGSDVGSVKYLFEITAAAIAQQNYCTAGAFEDYHVPKEFTPPREVTRIYKLVRDRIPEIIENSGKTCTYDILDDAAYLKMLDAKLSEELNEYQNSKSIEELADLLEVMGAVVKARGYTWEELTQIRKAKREKRGAFNKRIYLKEVIEEKS